MISVFIVTDNQSIPLSYIVIKYKILLYNNVCLTILLEAIASLVYLYYSHTAQGSNVNGTEDKHSQVLKAARSLFYKRTRSLYRWVYPKITMDDVNRRVADAWKSASKIEKNIYVSEVTYFHNNWQLVISTLQCLKCCFIDFSMHTY
jgi:hypothetical protein